MKKLNEKLILKQDRNKVLVLQKLEKGEIPKKVKEYIESHKNAGTGTTLYNEYFWSNTVGMDGIYKIVKEGFKLTLKEDVKKELKKITKLDLFEMLKEVKKMNFVKTAWTNSANGFASEDGTFDHGEYKAYANYKIDVILGSDNLEIDKSIENEFLEYEDEIVDFIKKTPRFFININVKNATYKDLKAQDIAEVIEDLKNRDYTFNTKCFYL